MLKRPITIFFSTEMKVVIRYVRTNMTYLHTADFVDIEIVNEFSSMWHILDFYRRCRRFLLVQSCRRISLVGQQLELQRSSHKLVEGWREFEAIFEQ